MNKGQRVLEEQLKSYTIQDFGPIGALTVDFTESPIVMLKGKNESGKSNVARALATLLYNTRQNSQKLLINDNAEAFTVTANFGGYQIIREKGKGANKNINSYTLLFDSEFLEEHPDAGLQDFYIANIGVSSEPPAPVVEILNMGYDKDTGEEFSYRRGGQMLLLSTLDSTNHKIVYNGLEASEIRAALKIAGEESKKLKDNYGKTATIRQHLQREVTDIVIPDISRLEKLYDEIQVHEKNKQHMDILSGDMSELEEIEIEFAAFAEQIESVDASNFELLCKVHNEYLEYQSIFSKLEKLEGNISEIDTTTLTLLGRVIEEYKDYLGICKQLEELPELTSISENDIMHLMQVRDVLREIQGFVKLDRELNGVVVELGKYREMAKEFEGEYKTCPQCGELILITDGDCIHG